MAITSAKLVRKDIGKLMTISQIKIATAGNDRGIISRYLEMFIRYCSYFHLLLFAQISKSFEATRENLWWYKFSVVGQLTLVRSYIQHSYAACTTYECHSNSKKLQAYLWKQFQYTLIVSLKDDNFVIKLYDTSYLYHVSNLISSVREIHVPKVTIQFVFFFNFLLAERQV